MSMFFIFMVLIVGAVGFFHYTQGLFSATISAILAIFSAVLALSYHETIIETFLGGAMADSASAMVLLVLFAAIYGTLRTIFDQLVPGGVSMPAMANKIGGAAMGVVAGIFAAGMCAFAAQTMSFNPAIMGYSRLQTEESSASIQESPEKVKRQQHPLYDFVQTNNPLHAAEDDLRTKMYLPVDDIVVDTAAMLSERGALSTSKPLNSIHPDWLTELFGQRLGIEPAGKRVAMNLAGGKQTDVVAVGGKESSHPDAGPAYVDHPLPQRLGEQDAVSKIRIDEKNPLFRAPTPAQMVIVIRVYFGQKTSDPKNNLIEVSCGAVRLCTQRPVEGSAGDLTWANYFPIGTLEDNEVLFRQRPDDFLFVDPSENPVVDFVFVVDAAGFLQEGKPPAPGPTGTPNPADVKAFLAKARISDGTFLEVKRLAREDLSNQSLNAFSALSKGKSTLLRKELVKKPPPPPPDTSNQAQVDPSVQPALTKKVIGTWEGTGSINNVENTISLVIGPTGTITGTAVPTSGPKLSRPIVGKWKVIGVVDDHTLRVDGDYEISPTPVAPETIQFRFDNDDQIAIVKKDGIGDSITLNRKAGTSPPPAGNGGTNTNPPPVAVQNYPNLTLLALPEENRKFYQAISVPAGTSGEATVAGGKVTVIDSKIAALSLNDADPGALRGAGDQINQFMQPEGSVLMQAEAAQTAGAWVFKDHLGEVVGMDASGKTYPLVGFWAVVGGKLVARFNPDGALSLADYTPSGPPSKIWLMFKGADSAPITKVMIGQQQIGVKQ